MENFKNTARISLITNFVLLVAVIALIRGCNGVDCPPIGQTITRHTDTFYLPVKDTVWLTQKYVPKPVKVFPVNVAQADTLPPYTGAGVLAENCLDTVQYSDEQCKDNSYSLFIDDLISGNRIIQREIKFANLTPTMVIHDSVTVTNTIKEKEKARLYLGGFITAGYGRALNPNAAMLRLGGGPQALLTFPKGAAIGYGYDLYNNSHQAQLLFKIRVKK